MIPSPRPFFTHILHIHTHNQSCLFCIFVVKQLKEERKKKLIIKKRKKWEWKEFTAYLARKYKNCKDLGFCVWFGEKREWFIHDFPTIFFLVFDFIVAKIGLLFFVIFFFEYLKIIFFYFCSTACIKNGVKKSLTSKTFRPKLESFSTCMLNRFIDGNCTLWMNVKTVSLLRSVVENYLFF